MVTWDVEMVPHVRSADCLLCPCSIFLCWAAPPVSGSSQRDVLLLPAPCVLASCRAHLEVTVASREWQTVPDGDTGDVGCGVSALTVHSRSEHPRALAGAFRALTLAS